jgi:two-component system, LytTR family, sensor kinase
MKLFHKDRLPLYLYTAAASFLIYFLIDLTSQEDHFFKETCNHFWLLCLMVVLHYFFFEKVLPFIKLRWDRILLSPFILFLSFIFYVFAGFFWRKIGILLHTYFEFTAYDSPEEALEASAAYSMGSIIFFGLIRYTYDHRKLHEKAQQLQIEKKAAELTYLKAQTNPHFLFNTLNNIYSLARDKSDLAPASILKLSQILRFMLYETQGDFIAVEQELKIMDDYIALEKLRYDDSLRLNFNYDVEDLKQALPPLLLIPLVENAFKHGASETRSQPFVDIHLSIRQRNLNFIVKNSTDTYMEQTIPRENIGLANLRRQLELLFREYKLETQAGEGVFTATLQIKLASHVQH